MKTESIDRNFKFEFSSNLETVKDLLNSNILNNSNSTNQLFSKSAYIEVLILLRDLLAKAEKIDEKITFDDHIQQKTLKFGKREIHINNITDLITYFRDGAVHSDSVHRSTSAGGRLSFCTIYGKSNSFGVNSEFEDDICYIFGQEKLYFKRHIYKVTSELEKLELKIKSVN